MNVHCGRWFKKFCEGDDSLDDEGQSSQPLELTTTNWEKSLKLILYSHTRSCHRTQCWPMVIRPLKPIERWKSLISGFLKSWANIKKKKLLFWSVMFSYSMQQQNISQWDCDMQQKVDFIRQLETTSSVAGLKRSSKALPKAKFEPKKVTVTVWWSAASLTHYSFLNSSATITSEKYAQQIKETHWKLQHLQPTLVTREGPVLFHDNVRPHVTQPTSARVTRFCLIHCTHLTSRPSATSSSIATTVCRENASTSSRSRKWFPGGHWIPQHGFFFARTKHLFLFGKKCVDYNGSYFD